MFGEKIQSLKKEIAKKKREAQAYVKLSESEKRDLTAEESAAIDQITDKDIPQLKAELARYQKLHAFSSDEDHSDDPGTVTTGKANESTVVVPALAKRHGHLKAFTGPTAEADAYLSGQWLMATLGKSEEAARWCEKHGVDTKHYAGMVTTDNQLGGYLIPTPMEISIVQLREEYGVFRREAYRHPMSSDVAQLTRPIGGMEAFFVQEGGTGQESVSKWEQIELVCRKLMALARMSKELSVDTIISVADQVARDVAWAFAKKEDECGFNGDGTSQYGKMVGLLHALKASSIYTALAGNLKFADLDLADFESMAGMLPEYAEANAKWYISKKGYWASMARLLDAAGGNQDTNLATAPQRTFLGIPVVFVPVMNTTLTNQASTKGLVYLGDLSLAATFADRAGMSIEASSEVHFLTDEIAIKGTQRFGLNVHQRGSADANDPAGPVIMLQTPAA